MLSKGGLHKKFRVPGLGGDGSDQNQSIIYKKEPTIQQINSNIEKESIIQIEEKNNIQDEKNVDPEPIQQQNSYYKCVFSQDIKKKNKSLEDGYLVYLGNKIKVFDTQGGLMFSNFKSKIYKMDSNNPDVMIIGNYYVEQQEQLTKEKILDAIPIEQELVELPTQQVQQLLNNGKQLQQNINKINQPFQKSFKIPTQAQTFVSKLQDNKNPEKATNISTAITTKQNVNVKENGSKEAIEHYYKCYFSKDVKKKHKSLEDGILVFIDNKVKIYNYEGQSVYDNYKSKLYYCNPDNENQFIVGSSYFVEQDQEIKKEDFLSGRCFVSSAKQTVDLNRMKNKYKPVGLKQQNQQQLELTPEDAYKLISPGNIILTDPSNKEIFPIFIDKFLADNMRPHQIEGVKFMFECICGLKDINISGCILADSMGLGKTLQAITLMYTLLKRNPFSCKKPFLNKVIIVTPLSLLGSWRNEIKKWLGSEKLVPLIACGQKERVNNICTDFATGKFRCLIISYETFRTQVNTLDGHCDLLIFDEGHRLKNMNIKTFQCVIKFQCCRRIILTGTPLQNSLEELYSCISFVCPNVFESLNKFKNVFAEPIFAALKTDADKGTLERAQERSKALTQIIQRFILRRKADILEKFLPQKNEYLIFIQLTEMQRNIYKKILGVRYSKWNYERDCNYFGDALGLLTVMRKLLNHPILLYRDENKIAQEFKQYFPEDQLIKTWDLSYKFIFLQSVLNKIQCINKGKQQKEKVIIVSYWTQTLDLVQELVNEMNMQFVRLDGSINAEKRQQIIDRFQDRTSSVTVFLLCAKAGGTGLNLTAANRMILMEVDWNPSNDLQVMARIWRDGQTMPVHIYRLVTCGTVEERILQRQFLKENLSQNVVDEQSNYASFDSDEMKKLFNFEDDQTCLSFNSNENMLKDFLTMSSDFQEDMKGYIVFLKSIQKAVKDSTTDTANQFENENIFLIKDNEGNAIQEEEDESKKEEEVLEQLADSILPTENEKASALMDDLEENMYNPFMQDNQLQDNMLNTNIKSTDASIPINDLQLCAEQIDQNISSVIEEEEQTINNQEQKDNEAKSQESIKKDEQKSTKQNNKKRKKKEFDDDCQAKQEDQAQNQNVSKILKKIKKLNQ